VRRLSEKRDGLIFMLWGRHAQAKEPLIDAARHHVLKSAHPSPHSEYNGFFVFRHFKKKKEQLKKTGKEPIDWQI
jgi:uracil-DNA glycosylase